MLKDLFQFIGPIIYLLLWILILKLAKEWGFQINALFLALSLIILLFSRLISKSTSWLIGYEKFGIKGDSTSKHVEFCADGVGTIKIFNDNLDEMEKLIDRAGGIVGKLKKK